MADSPTDADFGYKKSEWIKIAIEFNEQTGLNLVNSQLQCQTPLKGKVATGRYAEASTKDIVCWLAPLGHHPPITALLLARLKICPVRISSPVLTMVVLLARLIICPVMISSPVLTIAVLLAREK